MIGRRLAAVVILSAVLWPAIPANAATRCGVERWAVKTGTDDDVGAVNRNLSTATDIAYLDVQPAPDSLPSRQRLPPVETTRWVLDATLVEYKLETDSDYHLVLRDASGRSMIAEIPDPDCVGDSSPFLPGIRDARAAFDARFTAEGSFIPTDEAVRIVGIGFFDALHGQAGVAPNGVEIHPVLAIDFNPTSPLPAPQNPPAAVVHHGGPSAPTLLLVGAAILALLGGALLRRRSRLRR